MNNDIKTDLVGTKFYYVNNILHRENGPAIEWYNQCKEWYKNGERHREDGPAIEYPNGDKYWYFNDKLYGINNKFTNKSWKSFVKTLIFS